MFKLVIFDHKALLFSRIDRWEINLGDWFINEFDKKKELTGNCPVSSNVVQDMGEEFDFEAKPVPPERRRKSTLTIILNSN